MRDVAFALAAGLAGAMLTVCAAHWIARFESDELGRSWDEHLSY